MPRRRCRPGEAGRATGPRPSPQVFALAERIPERFRALILVTTFACLRWGEAAPCNASDIDLVAGTVRVRQAFVEHRGVG